MGLLKWLRQLFKPKKQMCDTGTQTDSVEKAYELLNALHTKSALMEFWERRGLQYPSKRPLPWQVPLKDLNPDLAQC